MDKKAKEILLKTYWTSTGWVSDKDRRINEKDFEYAKEKRVMFDPLTISKAELIDKLGSIVHTVSVKKLVNAFLGSLTNKRLDWRSGLASYANAERLLAEQDCSDYEYGYGENEDLNVLNFERIKWGGVRHHIGLYNWLDLTLLDEEMIPDPTEQDILVMKRILGVIDESRVGETPSKLRDRLKDVLKGSKAERGAMLEILGYAGILKPSRFDRKEPSNHDWNSILHWRGEDKYDKASLKKYFSDYGVV